MHGKKYYSRLSPILWPFSWLLILAVFYQTLIPVIEEPNLEYILISTIIYVPIFTFIIVIMLGTRYYVHEDELIIKIGPVTHSRFPIADILSIKRSYDPSSAPANALKRLKIAYREGEVLLSPMREKEFIEQLTLKNNAIKLFPLK